MRGNLKPVVADNIIESAKAEVRMYVHVCVCGYIAKCTVRT